MIILDDILLQRGTKILLDQANAKIFQNETIGLIGRNGAGKSSIFSLLLGKIEHQAGELKQPKQLQTAHLAQETPALEQAAIDYVLDGDPLFRQLETAIHSTKDLEKLGQLQSQFESIDGYRRKSYACKLLHGLGFEANDYEAPVNSFSGGWRMRLNLAQCLMTRAELLLLDEPTNYLDLNAILFLEKCLGKFEGTLLIISHDKAFLNRLCKSILHIENQKLNKYQGNYDDFERLRAEKLLLQQKMAEKQQKRIEHMMKFVERFKAKASKAKQAQSRMKAISKIEQIAIAHSDMTIDFQFKPCKPCRSPVIALEDTAIGYPNNPPLIEDINLSFQYGDRIAILGPNGLGKSTFLKVLAGKIAPLSGHVEKASHHMKLAYYEQHQLEQLDIDLTLLEQLQQHYPTESEQALRNYLGQFGFHGNTVLEKIAPLSGGEKARLVLAILLFQAPNVLLLDEPTNHLDLDMRAALEMALQEYEGTLIVVSHDRHLLETTIDDFYVLKDKRLHHFEGDLSAYETFVFQTPDQTNTASSKSSQHNRKQEKKWQNRIKKIETELDSLHQEQKSIEATLSLDATYTDQKLVQDCLDKQKALQTKVNDLENEWMTLQDHLS
jgi:ATP-binding cassette subfamily F protein 3